MAPFRIREEETVVGEKPGECIYMYKYSIHPAQLVIQPWTTHLVYTLYRVCATSYESTWSEEPSHSYIVLKQKLQGTKSNVQPLEVLPVTLQRMHYNNDLSLI